ncbi:DUF3108 domain-containing protein [Limnobacter sp.]|uniref:DUF3108 domain-containing protein n=1 Tax=Limnobacter sp. TaxID=2003368 RepID=UPI0025844FE9|nr:DUF3108 domain-containing protein [Limnobacter sp.]
MKYFVTLALSSVLALSAIQQPVQAGELKTCRNIADYLTGGTARYSLSYSQIPGQIAITTHEFVVSGNQYKLSSTSKATGFLAMLYSGTLNQKSEGVIEPGIGLVPIYYSEQRGKKPLQETVIDTEHKQVVFKKNGEKAALESRLQDRLSMIYEMGALLHCKGKVDQGDVMKMRVMTTGALDTEPFTFKKSENLELNLGKESKTVKTYLFELAPQEADDDTVRLWFAPDLNWTAAQIQVEDHKGAQLTQTLVGLQ